MTAPNLVASDNVKGDTELMHVTTTPTAIVSNASDSGKTIKVNTLVVANVDGTNSADVTVEIYRSSESYYQAKALTVPPKSSVQIIDRTVYLREGDSIRVSGSANGDLDATASFEEVS